MRDSFSSISILDFSGCQNTLMIGWMGVQFPKVKQKYHYIIVNFFYLNTHKVLKQIQPPAIEQKQHYIIIDSFLFKGSVREK